MSRASTGVKPAAIIPTNIGSTDDGKPLLHYAGEHIVITGPSQGSVTTSDGTVYDVSPHVIAVAEDHVGEVAHLIGEMVEDQGHPDHDAEHPFFHHCTDSCGVLKRDITHPTQAYTTDRAATQVAGIEDAFLQRDNAIALLGEDPGDPGPQAARASAVAENAALNGLDGTGSSNVIPDVALNTGDPGTTGANENANTGSYARQACSWNAASGGAKTNSTALAFSTAGSVAVSFFSTWSSATYGAGNFAIGGALGSAVTAASITIAAGAISLSAS